MQIMCAWPLNKIVHSAMMANVGAAARPSQPAAPEVARPPPAQVSTSWRTTGDIDTSVMAVPIVVTPPDTRLVAALGGAVRQIAIEPAGVFVGPGLLQAPNGRGGQPASVLAEQRAKRLLKVA